MTQKWMNVESLSSYTCVYAYLPIFIFILCLVFKKLFCVCEVIGELLFREVKNSPLCKCLYFNILRAKWNYCFQRYDYQSQGQPSISHEERSHQKQTMLGSWSWTSDLQNYDKMSFCCLSHSVYGILLWQPKLIRGLKHLVRLLPKLSFRVKV